MSKKLTPKQQLQADYKEKFGVEADSKMTASELSEALEQEPQAKEEKSKKEWVNDPNLLQYVESQKESIVTKDKKGNLVGGKEYFGVLKTNK